MATPTSTTKTMKDGVREVPQRGQVHAEGVHGGKGHVAREGVLSSSGTQRTRHGPVARVGRPTVRRGPAGSLEPSAGNHRPGFPPVQLGLVCMGPVIMRTGWGGRCVGGATAQQGRMCADSGVK